MSRCYQRNKKKNIIENIRDCIIRIQPSTLDESHEDVCFNAEKSEHLNGKKNCFVDTCLDILKKRAKLYTVLKRHVVT